MMSVKVRYSHLHVDGFHAAFSLNGFDPAVILKIHENEPLFAEILRLTVLRLALLVVFEVDKNPEGDEHQAEDQGDEEPGAGESFEDFLFDDGGEHMGDLPENVKAAIVVETVKKGPDESFVR
jgi:hypothetical protein